MPPDRTSEPSTWLAKRADHIVMSAPRIGTILAGHSRGRRGPTPIREPRNRTLLLGQVPRRKQLRHSGTPPAGQPNRVMPASAKALFTGADRAREIDRPSPCLTHGSALSIGVAAPRERIREPSVRMLAANTWPGDCGRIESTASRTMRPIAVFDKLHRSVLHLRWASGRPQLDADGFKAGPSYAEDDRREQHYQDDAE